ncbi:MAG: hypothetical protein K6A70_07335, partial [Erysipelotrichaceae bacterium]|nr:hypothetical protein [Erysipelotrichaceae bacterium]
MKFNFKGIRFSTWLYFLGFSLTIMLLLGFLLVVLIKPYYRNDRLNTIDTISETIENLLLKKNVNNQDIESAARTIVGNNVCAIIYNENGKSIYSPPDSLGQLCMLDKQITVGDMTYTIKDEPEKMIALIKNYNPFSQTIYSQFTGIE